MVKKSVMPKFVEGVGKRKSAVSRVRIFELGKEKFINIAGNKFQKGDVFVNLKPFKHAFPSEVDRNISFKPLVKTDTLDKFAISIFVSGGGHKGQVESIAQGISKALMKVDLKYRPILKKEGLLTRDARVRESRKVGTGGKARRKKQSPKR